MRADAVRSVRRRLTQDRVRPTVHASSTSSSYAHFLPILGIVVTAVGIEEVLARIAPLAALTLAAVVLAALVLHETRRYAASRASLHEDQM